MWVCRRAGAAQRFQFAHDEAVQHPVSAPTIWPLISTRLKRTVAADRQFLGAQQATIRLPHPTEKTILLWIYRSLGRLTAEALCAEENFADWRATCLRLSGDADAVGYPWESLLERLREGREPELLEHLLPGHGAEHLGQSRL